VRTRAQGGDLCHNLTGGSQLRAPEWKERHRKRFCHVHGGDKVVPTGFLLPPSLDEWLPERHLARFVGEVIDGLDLAAMVKSYRGSGAAGYNPALLLGLLVYGYTTGVFSSRKLERRPTIR
jgi:hypothetical protein